MSDLVDRYLAAVAALLPKAQREDIVAELRDLIVNRIEEREAQLSRPLDKREIEALLREIGHTIAVAGRYGPRTSLIGPELYPFWMFGVKVLLAIAALAVIVPAGVVLITGQGDGRTVSGAINAFIDSALGLIGFAVIVGAAIERGWIKLGDFSNWKASELPRVPDGKGWFVKSRFDGVFEVVVMLLFIGWWTGLVSFPVDNVIRTRGGEAFLEVTPALATFYWPVLIMAIVQAGSGLILVIKPGWVRARDGAEILGALIGLGVTALLWRAMPLFTVAAPAAAEPGLANLQRTLDLAFEVALVVAAAINLTKLLVHGWRLVRGR